MSRRVALLLPSLALLAGLVAWSVTGLPDFAHPVPTYARAAVHAALGGRHVTDTVGGVTFDVRGFDTLGEEFILFASALGASILLRSQRGERDAGRAAERAEEQRAGTTGALRSLAAALVGPLVVFGGYIVTHGHLSPGGGFQGGLILASVLLLVFAAGQLTGLERLRPEALVAIGDAVGALAFALVAVGGLVFASAALANFLPFGTQGSLLSGGTIPILNIAVGVEVAGGVSLIFTELLDQALLRSSRGEA